VCLTCRSPNMLKNNLASKIGLSAAENDPSEVS